MVTPHLSNLTKQRPKGTIHRKAPTRTIHNLKRSHEGKQKEESITKTNLLRKMTDELLDEISEQ